MTYSWDCLSLSQAVEWAATGSRWKHLYPRYFGFIFWRAVTAVIFIYVDGQAKEYWHTRVHFRLFELKNMVNRAERFGTFLGQENALKFKFKSECHFLSSNNCFRAKDEANQNVSLSQFPLMSVQPHILYVVIDWELGHMVHQQSAQAPQQQRQRACGGPQGFKYRCCCKETPNTEARILHTHVQNTFTILFLR